MKKVFFLAFIISSCSSIKNSEVQKNDINLVLNNWHKAAANANFTDYFNVLSPIAIYIGTDATENWTKPEFEAFAKPYFDKGKAWSFTRLERHIFFDKSTQTAWFDELLNTQMKICRGSGVLEKINNEWKIKQYVLSMTMPNDKIEDVLNLKSVEEDSIIRKLQKK